MLEYFREHHRYGEKADFSIRRISLFFVDPAIEADFKTYYFETNLQLWRACHLISVFFYALVSLWDGIVVAPERFEIRLNVLGVVAAFFLAGLLASFSKKRLYSRYWQPLFAFYVLLTGSGFAWVTIQTAPLYPDSNFVGVFFCLIFCYCFIRLTFVFAIAAGSAIILIYALSVWWFIPPGTPQIQTHIFYLAGMNLLGMMVCYAMELISRHEFVLKQLMGQAENRVTRMNQRLENMVAKRTHDLREKNKALEKSVDREKDLVMKLEADEAILQKSLASLSQAESIAKLGYFERNWKTGQGYWSKGFLSLMGLPENFSEPRMDDFLDRLVPGDRKRYEREMMESLIQGKTLDIELALESGPGRATHVHCIADHYYDDDALPLSTRGVFQDISEHVRDRDQVRQLENQLLQAQKMESLGTLAGGIAHDFNNILSPIVGLAELLAEDLEKQSQGSDSARQILTAALRGSDLVRQILSFSRRTDFEPVSVDVSFVVREVLKLARASIPADIEIREHIEQDCPPVLADPVQLHQVGMNLITNAYHALSPAGGLMTVSLERQELEASGQEGRRLPAGIYTVLTVSDTGTGMAPEVAARIFDPYFTTKEKGKGTGLGLATVYGIINSVGGDIRVSSQPGRGSRFTVLLPGIHPEPVRPGDAAAKETDLRGQGHILLVDDESPIVDYCRFMLERLGYTVSGHVTSTGALAEFKADPDRFDAVITDMTMPGIMGDELAARIREERNDIPVIICTGFSERINREKAMKEGISAVLDKPVPRAVLAGFLKKVLNPG